MPRWNSGLKLEKDPQAVLDYKFDWSEWLGDDTISSRTVTVEDGLTKDSDSITDSATSVTVWLSGGAARTSYAMTCRIVTAGGRTDERTVTVDVRDK